MSVAGLNKNSLVMEEGLGLCSVLVFCPASGLLRDSFLNYFHENFIGSQKAQQSSLLKGKIR